MVGGEEEKKKRNTLPEKMKGAVEKIAGSTTRDFGEIGWVDGYSSFWHVDSKMQKKTDLLTIFTNDREIFEKDENAVFLFLSFLSFLVFSVLSFLVFQFFQFFCFFL